MPHGRCCGVTPGCASDQPCPRRHARAGRRTPAERRHCRDPFLATGRRGSACPWARLRAPAAPLNGLSGRWRCSRGQACRPRGRRTPRADGEPVARCVRCRDCGEALQADDSAPCECGGSRAIWANAGPRPIAPAASSSTARPGCTSCNAGQRPRCVPPHHRRRLSPPPAYRVGDIPKAAGRGLPAGLHCPEGRAWVTHASTQPGHTPSSRHAPQPRRPRRPPAPRRDGRIIRRAPARSRARQARGRKLRLGLWVHQGCRAGARADAAGACAREGPGGGRRRCYISSGHMPPARLPTI